MPRHVWLVVLASVVVAATATPAVAAEGGNSANAKACQKDGWLTFVTSTGESFASGDACASYGAQGGVRVPASAIAPCLDGGWAAFVTSDGDAFAGEQECRGYAAQAGPLVPKPPPPPDPRCAQLHAMRASINAIIDQQIAFYTSAGTTLPPGLRAARIAELEATRTREMATIDGQLALAGCPPGADADDDGRSLTQRPPRAAATVPKPSSSSRRVMASACWRSVCASTPSSEAACSITSLSGRWASRLSSTWTTAAGTVALTPIPGSTRSSASPACQPGTP